MEDNPCAYITTIAHQSNLQPYKYTFNNQNSLSYQSTHTDGTNAFENELHNHSEMLIEIINDHITKEKNQQHFQYLLLCSLNSARLLMGGSSTFCNQHHQNTMTRSTTILTEINSYINQSLPLAPYLAPIIGET